jgi:chromosome segregation ATPase
VSGSAVGNNTNDHQQLVLTLTPDDGSWEKAGQPWLNDGTDGRSRAQSRLDRIQQLEQALDQTLASLSELNQQIRDQGFLERQLAHTEQFSHVQQQAIAKLTEQLESQRLSLEQTHQEQSGQKQPLPDKPAAIEPIPSIQALDLSELKHPQDSAAKEATQQLFVQASLQHFCQELAAERDNYRQRVMALEQQVTELQEHVLQQEQQTKEYEATIQHWRDRAAASHRYALHLKELLEQVIADRLAHPLLGETQSERSTPIEPNVLLPSLMMAFNALVDSETIAPEVAAVVAPSSELPAFLTRRRRNYRAS